MSRTTAGRAFSVGFVLFVGLLLVIVTLFWIGSGRGILERRVHYVALLPTTGGLTKGAKVFLSGVPVGVVSRIAFAPDPAINKVKLTLEVDQDAAARIRADSTLWLQTQGLLGDYTVQISQGTLEKPVLEPGSEIPFAPRSILDDIAGEDISHGTAALLRNMIGILQEIQRGSGTIGQLFKDPQLYENLNGVLASMRGLTLEVERASTEFRTIVEQLKSREGLVGKLLFSPDYARDVESAISGSSRVIGRLDSILARIERGDGTLGKLAVDFALYDKTLTAVEQVERLSRGVADEIERSRAENGVVDRLIGDRRLGEKLASLVERLDSGAASLEVVLGLLEEGKGSAGMLLHDPSIAASLRNIFLGVQDMGYVLDLARSAEMRGQEIALRERRISPQALRETGRIDALRSGTAAPDEAETRETSSPEEDAPGPSSGSGAPGEPH